MEFKEFYRKFSFVIITIISVSFIIFSCNFNQKEQKTEQRKRELIRKSNEERELYMREMTENKAIEQAFVHEQHQKLIDKEKEDFMNWLQGTWEWSGLIHIYGSQYKKASIKLTVDGDYITCYGDGDILDQDIIKNIDFEEGVLSYGECSMLGFDYDNRILYMSREDETCLHKVSSSSPYGTSNSRSSYSGGSSNRITTFNTSSDVMAYVSNRFRNSTGNVITVKYNGIYCNGNPITNAVRVVRFNGSHATLSATSPYASGTLYFSVDASRGTITDNSGDVFYIQ